MFLKIHGTDLLVDNYKKLYFYPVKKIYRFYLIVFFIAFSFFLSYTQALGISPDYLNYEIFLDLTRIEGLNTLNIGRFEPGFTLYSLFLSNFLTNNVLIYSYIVISCILIKNVAISFYCSSNKIFIIAFIFYFCRFFPLHELTQIRVACATGLLMLAARLIWEKKYLYGCIFSFLSLSFHFSSVAVIPIIFIEPYKRRSVIGLSFFVVCVSYFFCYSVTEILSNYISILATYQSLGFGDKPNPLSFVLLLDWLMIFFALYHWKILTSVMKRAILMQLIGMAVFYGTLDLPVIAHRLREMFCVFWVFFVANGLQIKKIKLPIFVYVLISLVSFSYIYIFSGKFFYE